MNLGYRLLQTQVCRICKQDIDSDAVSDTAFDVAFFGTADQYVVCPCCGQKVANKTVAYMKRVVKFWERAVKELEKGNA